MGIHFRFFCAEPLPGGVGASCSSDLNNDGCLEAILGPLRDPMVNCSCQCLLSRHSLHHLQRHECGGWKRRCQARTTGEAGGGEDWNRRRQTSSHTHILTGACLRDIQEQDKGWRLVRLLAVVWVSPTAVADSCEVVGMQAMFAAILHYLIAVEAQQRAPSPARYPRRRKPRSRSCNIL